MADGLLLVRFVWSLLIGWWASGIAIGIAWVAHMLNRTPFFASLYRY